MTQHVSRWLCSRRPSRPAQRATRPSVAARLDLQRVHLRERPFLLPRTPRRSSKPGPVWSPPGLAGRTKGIPTSESGHLATMANGGHRRSRWRGGTKGESAALLEPCALSAQEWTALAVLQGRANPRELVGHVDHVDGRRQDLVETQTPPRRLPRSGQEQADRARRTARSSPPPASKTAAGASISSAPPTSAKPGRRSGPSTTTRPGRPSSRPCSPIPTAASRLFRGASNRKSSNAGRPTAARPGRSSSPPRSPTPTPASMPSLSPTAAICSSTIPPPRAAARSLLPSLPMARPGRPPWCSKTSPASTPTPP